VAEFRNIYVKKISWQSQDDVRGTAGQHNPNNAGAMKKNAPDSKVNMHSGFFLLTAARHGNGQVILCRMISSNPG
jgi:hypothetical protein